MVTTAVVSFPKEWRSFESGGGKLVLPIWGWKASLIPVKVLSRKRSAVGAVTVPFTILGRKKNMTGNT